MKLLLDTNTSILTIRSYEAGAVQVGERILRSPFIITPQQLIAEWSPGPPASLDEAALAPLLALKIKVLLLGTGASVVRPPFALRHSLEQRGIALDTMDLGAACRTYNVLATEGRQVAAGIFPS
jgi:uncharacterized protein